METTIMAYIGPTMKIYSFIPSEPKVCSGLRDVEFRVKDLGLGFRVEGLHIEFRVLGLGSMIQS